MTGHTFARNSAFNLIGMMLPLILAVVAIPPLVRGLGADRFGILTLAWAAIGYFGLFEFGLSRALTQAVALRIGNKLQDELPSLVWAALFLLLLLGVVGAVIIAVATPTLVTRILNVPPELRGEATASFYILALSLPLVVTTAGLRGLMEAHQHFGMVAALRLPLAALMLLGPLMILPISRSLVAAVSMLAVGRFVTWVAHIIVCMRRYPFMRKQVPPFRIDAIVPLLRFGGWTTVTNVVGPIMVYVDRFLIAALLPIAAVAHYVTPYEVVTKFTMIPAAIVAAMFPALAAAFASDRSRMAHLYDRALRSVVLLVFPLILITVALAHEGLRLWMGHTMPVESATVLQWLAIGVFINAIAQAPYAALQSAGRPDITAKLHVIELPFYAALIWILADSMGLVGVAIAWTIRVTIDAALLLVVTQRKLALPLIPGLGSPWTVAAMLAALAGAGLATGTLVRVVYVGIVGIVFAATAWQRLLTVPERNAVLDWIRSPRSSVAETTERLA